MKKIFESLEQRKLRKLEELNKAKPIVKKWGRCTKMREIKIKRYRNGINDFKYIVTIRNANSTCEYIGLVDQNGQDLYTNDLVIIENNLMLKQFRIVFNREQLAFGFQTEDEARIFYTLKEIRGLFGEQFTVTKTGNIFKPGG